MTSIDQSRQWAEVVLAWLNEASSEYRYWDQLASQVDQQDELHVFFSFGMSKKQVAAQRNTAWNKFIFHK
jgi:hypothetical protein